ncbi:LptF/LptG family permease [Synechococcus sp. MIT S1220]|uniref:LptF/LptG family permease n=1 Tax=Synechococcus sp. MIT S1220 TaxID=3082549 RepID=UPI0039AF8C9E
MKQLKRLTWMRLPLLDRWMVVEVIGPLLFFIALFTLLLLTGGVMFELVRQMVDKNLPLAIAVQVLLFSMPRWLAFSVPMGTLMACLFVFTRLSANSELTALRSLGVTTIRMITAAMVLSIVMTGFTFFLNDVVVPRSNRFAEVTLQRALGRSLATEKGEDIIYPQFGRLSSDADEESRRGLTQLFYARSFANGEMLNVTVLDFSRVGFTQMLVAEKAIWNEAQAQWDFFDGQNLTLSPNGSSTKVEFDRYVYPLGSGPLRLTRIQKDAVNMTVAEARQAERLYVEAGNNKDARKIRVRIQEKFTFPLACVVFGLFGATLGAQPSYRTSRSFAFVLTLGIIVVYYVISFSFSSLGVKGTLPPVVAAWLPVLIGIGGGSALLCQASR